jgi:hypothetical protein
MAYALAAIFDSLFPPILKAGSKPVVVRGQKRLEVISIEFGGSYAGPAGFGIELG